MAKHTCLYVRLKEAIVGKCLDYVGRLKEDKDYFNKFCFCCRIFIL